MPENRKIPKPIGRLHFERNIPVTLGPLVNNGAVDTQPDSEAFFLGYTDRDLVLDEVILFVGERYESVGTNQAVTVSIRWLPATFDAAITNADKAATWTNTAVSKQVAASYSTFEKAVFRVLGPTDNPVTIPAGSHYALVVTDAGSTFPLRRVTGVNLQLRGYYPKV
jgi:hypothetical protein